VVSAIGDFAVQAFLPVVSIASGNGLLLPGFRPEGKNPVHPVNPV